MRIKWLNNKPFVRQFDQMDCGPACVRMVCKYYGRDYPLSYLRSLSHLSREGVSVSGIRKALGHIGMRSATFEMTMDQLVDRCPLPAILHWEQNHFVVLYGIGRSRWSGGMTFEIANPAYGKHRVGEREFMAAWLGGGRGVAIVVEPTASFYQRTSMTEKHSLVAFARKYAWPFRRELSQLSLGLFGGTLLSMVAPFLTQALVDNGINQRDMGVVTSLLLAQLFIFLGSFSMGIISNWVTLFMGTRVNINILHDYLDKLLRLPMTFFDTKSVGDYNQRIADHSRLQGFTTQATLNTAFSIISASTLLVVIGYYSVFILAVYLSLTACGTLWMGYFWRRRKALDYENFRLVARSQSKLYEMMGGIVDIKVNAIGDLKIREWEELQEEQYRMAQKNLRLGQVQSTGYVMIGRMRNILITFWIAAEVIHGDLTLGMMMGISSIIGQVDAPLSQLTDFLQRFQDAKISLERSEEVYLCENEDSEGLQDVPGDRSLGISLRNVSFSYDGESGRKALDGVSLDIPAGKMTAIVGESGSGKSTLMKLLLKFYPPTDGTITLGDKDLSEFKAMSVRNRTGIVMQENFIFSDTICQNIVLDQPVDERRLAHAIDMACLTEYISGLPLGVNTKIGADGIGLSGGEKQRLMIARAVYKHPLYMMLDEATSSLDSENEMRITQNLWREFQDRTLLVIAHRLSTVKNADNIIVLRHGKVVESGRHSDLVRLRGYYYELVRNQLEMAES